MAIDNFRIDAHELSCTYAGTALLRHVGKLSFRSLWTPNWRCSHVTKSGIQFCRFWCVAHENGRYPISLLQRSYRPVSREGTLLENNIMLRFVTARNVLKILMLKEYSIIIHKLLVLLNSYSQIHFMFNFSQLRKREKGTIYCRAFF